MSGLQHCPTHVAMIFEVEAKVHKVKLVGYDLKREWSTSDPESLQTHLLENVDQLLA